METSTIITIIVCVAVMGLAIWYYYNACQTYDKADRMRIEAEAAEETHEETKALLNGLITVGEPLRYFIRQTDTSCDVLADYDTFGDKIAYNIIKRFPFADDKDYALREAEYLLETLNEK